ncbi:MAG: hypothetical protein ABEJ23_03370 [Haloarculaceae archaeon]
MGAIPGDLSTDAQPPMTVPLRHFVVGLGFLLAGGGVGALLPFGLLPGQPTLAHVHLLLAGWVCITIMGAMTQFVPVWSGTTLHSRRLATVQLWLVTVGLVGFVGAFLGGLAGWLPVFGAVVLAGFWTFVYNVGRTLLPARPWDVTERHFAVALGFFLLVTTFGLTLAVAAARPLLGGLPVTYASLRAAHATLAVFGAVLTTVLGALYQLATMFTQSDLHGIDHWLRRVEEAAYPVGVVVLAAGRLFGLVAVGRLGGALVVAGLLAFSVVLVRRLYEARVPWTPMLSRYAVAAVAMAAWALLALPGWLANPVAPGALFGSPALVHLLVFGVIGFVVLGTLYHVVPFIVWVHQYSDQLGFGDVPMIDDLYDDRLATVDLVALLVGSGTLVVSEWVALPAAVTAAGGAVAVVGFVVFAANVLLVIREHSPRSLGAILLPALADREPAADARRDLHE